MKFHCDRCKTRYAIADERVRGKILKIRCKNCSAVITVREGMGEPSGEIPLAMASGLESGPAPSRSGPVIVPTSGAHRVQDPGQRAGHSGTPRPALARDSAGHRGTPRPALAREAAAHSATPRPALAREAAAHSATPRPALAREAPRSETPSYSLPPSAQRFGTSPTNSEDEPHRRRFDSESLTSGEGVMVWYVSFEGESNGPMSLEDVREWIAGHDEEEELFCWRQGFSDWQAVEEVDAFRGLRARPPTHTALTPRPDSRAATEVTPRPRFGTSNPGFQENSPGFRVTEVDSPGRPSPSPFDPDTARAGHRKPASGPLDDDLDFEIGEPSRIVKLPMLAAQARKGKNGASAPGAALPGMGSGPVARRTGQVSAMGGMGPGGVIADPASEVGLPPLPRRRSLTPLVLAALGVVLASAAVLAFFVVSRPKNSDADVGARAAHRTLPSDLEALGFRHDNPTSTRSGSDSKQAPGVTTEPDRPRSRGKTSNRDDDTTAHTAISPPDLRVDPTSDPRDGRTPLSPDEVQSMATKSQAGLVRCYERAKRKDPFLEVKSLRVTLTVGVDGKVTRVSLSSQQGTDLGTCLENSVSRWRFRESREGIATEITLKFGT